MTYVKYLLLFILDYSYTYKFILYNSRPDKSGCKIIDKYSYYLDLSNVLISPPEDPKQEGSSLGSQEFGKLNNHQKKEFLKSVCSLFEKRLSNSFMTEEYFVNLSIELDMNIFEEFGSERKPVIIYHKDTDADDQIPYLLGVQIKMKPVWKWNKVLYEALGNLHII